jgi:hypothetical protein
MLHVSRPDQNDNLRISQVVILIGMRKASLDFSWTIVVFSQIIKILLTLRNLKLSLIQMSICAKIS